VKTVADLLCGEWAAMLEREGVPPACATSAAANDQHPPCPACGTAAPLVDGACSDCGLQLDERPSTGPTCGPGGCR
jgi:predicted amidophosphoribosyltransferase